MAEEYFVDIKGYEGLYQVSNKGNIYSCRRNRLMKINSNGRYSIVTLTKDKQTHTFKVHRLVAEAFIPNLNNYPMINHKDEDRYNNCVENLEWCTAVYNNTYGTRIERSSAKLSETLQGRKPWNTGKHWSDEVKQRISEAQKLRYKS